MSQRAAWDTMSWETALDRIRSLLRTEIGARSEFSPTMLVKQISAMMVSLFKYGLVADAYPHKVDAIGSLKLRLEKYAETGNVEYLVDVANFAMIEFMYPRHPHAFFKGTDSDGSPGRVALNDMYDQPVQTSNLDLLEKDEAFGARPKVGTRREGD